MHEIDKYKLGNEIDNYMTVNEAAERWHVSAETVKGKLKPSVQHKHDLDNWIKRGLIKPFTKRNGTNQVWIISVHFMRLHFGEERGIVK